MNYEKNFTPYLTLPYLSRIMLKPQVLRLYLSLFLLFGFVGFGQENDKKLDSLTTKFKTLKGKEKLHFAVLTYLPYFQHKNPKRSIEIVDSLLPYTKNKLKNYRVALYNQKGTSYELLLKDSLALNSYDKAIKTAHNIADSIGVVRGLQSKGIFYGRRRQFDSCLTSLEKAKTKIDNNIYNPAVDSLQNKALAMEIRSNLALLYTVQQKWDKAVDYNYEVLELAESLKKDDIKLLSFGYLASIFQSIRNYDKAYDYSKKEMDLAKKVGDPIKIGYSLLHYAEVLIFKDSSFVEAEDYCKKALKL